MKMYILTDVGPILEIDGVQVPIVGLSKDSGPLDLLSHKDGVATCKIRNTDFVVDVKDVSQSDAVSWVKEHNAYVELRSTRQYRKGTTESPWAEVIIYNAGLGNYTPQSSKPPPIVRPGDEVIILTWWDNDVTGHFAAGITYGDRWMKMWNLRKQ